MGISKIDEEKLPKGLRSAQGGRHYGYLREDGYVLLECKEDGADKFYGAIPDEGGWVVFWGRNGKRPQQSQRVDRWEAQSRVHEKISKGYADSPNPEKLVEAFFTAPEWFRNIRGLSEHFTALMENAAMQLRIKEADQDTEAAKRNAEKRRNFRL